MHANSNEPVICNSNVVTVQKSWVQNWWVLLVKNNMQSMYLSLQRGTDCGKREGWGGWSVVVADRRDNMSVGNYY